MSVPYVHPEKVIEFRRKGRDITVYRQQDGTYSCFDNGRETQWDLSAEEVMNWLANMCEDGS